MGGNCSKQDCEYIKPKSTVNNDNIEDKNNIEPILQKKNKSKKNKNRTSKKRRRKTKRMKKIN